MAQGTLLYALWWPELERRPKVREYRCMYDWLIYCIVEMNSTLQRNYTSVNIKKIKYRKKRTRIMCGLKQQGERNFSSPNKVNDNNSSVHQRIKTESCLRKECSSDGQPLLWACCHSFVEVGSEGVSARKDLRASDARWKTWKLSQVVCVCHGPLPLAEDTCNFLEFILTEM